MDARARVFLMIVAALLLPVACGGGGGSGTRAQDATDDGGGIPDDGSDDDAGDTGGTGGGGLAVPLAVRTLDAGESSGITTASTRTARSLAEYHQMWQQHRPAWGSGGPEPPYVDFTTEIVVAVFVGPRYASGFGAEIVAAATWGEFDANVQWNETVPGPSCPPGLPVVTAPYAIAAMSRVEGSVHFLAGVREIPCK